MKSNSLNFDFDFHLSSKYDKFRSVQEQIRYFRSLTDITDLVIVIKDISNDEPLYSLDVYYNYK